MPNKVAIALLLLLAVVLRAWDFPHRHELRNADELPYVGGSLHLLEGMVPPCKYSPAGPQMWAGWLWAGGETARYVAQPTAEERGVDARVRPFIATNHAIWNNYADMGVMRWLWVAVTLPVVLWALIEAFKLGVYATGETLVEVHRTEVREATTRGRGLAEASEPAPAATPPAAPSPAPAPFDGPPIEDPPIAIASPPPPHAPPPAPPPARPAAPAAEPIAVTEETRTRRNPVATAAGFLAAGFVAFMPLFVHLGGEGRPYVMGWCLGIIALCLAIRRHDPRGQILSAVVMGLAIASRIDMLMLLPIVWSEQFARRREYGFFRGFIGYHLIAGIVVLLFAPWILTNLIGNLRIIATVRLAAPARTVTLADTLFDFAVTQGLWLLPLLALIGALWPRRERKFPRILLAAYVVLVGASISRATGFGLQHQGGPLVILIVMSALGLRAISRLGGRVAWVVCLLALIVPAVQAVRSIAQRQRNYVDDTPAVAWIEGNVPTGTRVYVVNSIFNPLPTREASDALWAEVNHDDAWAKKLLSGLSRFNLSADQIPRALSEENMLVERGNRRGWFILGSRGDVARPRYDVRVVGGSPIFGVHDLPGEFAKTGGVVLWRGTLDDPEIKGFPPPAQRWDAPGGKYGVYVFASNDVKLPAGATTATAPATAPISAVPPITAATSPATSPATTRSATTQSAP